LNNPTGDTTTKRKEIIVCSLKLRNRSGGSGLDQKRLRFKKGGCRQGVANDNNPYGMLSDNLIGLAAKKLGVAKKFGQGGERGGLF